jgi:hypothetical protein
MNPSRISLTFLILVALIAGNGGAAIAAPSNLQAGSAPIISRIPDGLLLTWQLPDPTYRLQADGTTQVSLAGFELSNEPGRPKLPYYSTLIALPAGASPSPETSESVLRQVTLEQTLSITPEQTLTKPDGTPLLQSGQTRSAPNPSRMVELTPVGDLQGVRLARLTFRPVILQGGSLQVAVRFQVKIHFNSTYQPASVPTQALQEELAGLVINPEDISVPLSGTSLQPSRLAAAQPGKVAIEIGGEGVYRITRSALTGINFPIDNVDPHNFHLTHAGIEIPYEWEGNSDTVFDANESIDFYARPAISRWSNYDVYFLSAGDSTGPLITEKDATITSETAGTLWFEQTFEQNGFYTPDCGCAPVAAGRDGDRWVWDEIGIQRNYAPSASRSYPFALTNGDISKAASLTVWLIGFTDPPEALNHRVQVSINGTPLGLMEWKGKVAQEAIFAVPAGVLQAANSLTFTLPGISGVDVEGVWLDAFSLKYQPGAGPWNSEAIFTGSGGSGQSYQVNLNQTVGVRVYDVTDPAAPVRLTGVTVGSNSVAFADKVGSSSPRFEVVTTPAIHPVSLRLVPALRTAAVTGADYVIIAPDAFFSSLSSLVDLRQSQGLSTVAEDLQAIFDQYGEGIPRPEAIHAYLQDIYTRWNPKPQYVLLVGDGTNDPKLYYPGHFKSIIPPYLADFDPYTTEGATDNLYVTFGGPDDLIPDMLIGRLPVNTVDELNVIVNKIVQYETNPAPGNWKNKATFLAARTDMGGDFGAAAIDESAQLLTKVPVDRILYPGVFPEVVQAKSALLSDWNSGTGLIVFNGHAGIHQWATRDESANFSEFFHVNDVAGLSNGSKLPVVLSMTCYTGAYQTAGLSTLDETLVRAANGGALATWGSSGLGTTSGHEFLAQGFVNRVISQAGTRLGQAALAGKLLVLARHPSNAYMLDSFNLLGDPASILTFTQTQKNVFLPTIHRP